MPLALITTCLMCRDRFFVVSLDELGVEAGIVRLLVSSGLSTPIFALIGSDDFWNCLEDFWQKMSLKKEIFSFLGYLGEIDSDYHTVGPAYALYTVARSVLPIFKS